MTGYDSSIPTEQVIQMKRDELIAALMAIPQNVEVVLMHADNCCCGECFLPVEFPISICGCPFYDEESNTIHL